MPHQGGIAAMNPAGTISLLIVMALAARKQHAEGLNVVVKTEN